MRNTCKICWLILALFLLGNIILLGVWWFDTDAQENRIPKQFNKEDHRLRMREQLLHDANINEAQFDEMYKNWKGHSKQMYQSQMEIDSLRQQLMNETFSNKTDTQNVNKLLNEVANKQRRIEEANYHHFRKLRDICETDQQREMLDKMFRNRIMKDAPKKRSRGRRHRQ